MSATLDTNNVPSWRKRQREESESVSIDIKELKRPRLYYFRLASESSKCSDDDTESICSMQDKETDVVRDTSDTDSRANDLSEYELEIEYEVESCSDGDGARSTVSSTDSDGMVLSAAAAIIIHNNTSLEAFITDGEDSDNSSSDETSFGRTDFRTCVQCNGTNDNPLYRYCEKCFQARKRFFPPRPRKKKRCRNKEKCSKEKAPVKLDLLRNCLSGLSQDSGISSSQECPHLDLDQIVVPETSLTKTGTSSEGTTDTSRSLDDGDEPKTPSLVPEMGNSEIISKTPENEFTDSNRTPTPDLSSKFISEEKGKTYLNLDRRATRRKRTFSESSLSDFDDVKKPKLSNAKNVSETSSQNTESFSQSSAVSSSRVSGMENSAVSSSGASSMGSLGSGSFSELELCIFCNDAPKDSIFLHTNIAHRCCCYKCAKKTLRMTKRCPICNRSVNKVLKIFTS